MSVTSSLVGIPSRRAERAAVARAVLDDPPQFPGPPLGVVRDVRGEILHASRTRPVVRWDVVERAATTTTRTSVVGKIYGKGGGKQAHALLQHLWSAGFSGPYAVPQPLGYLPHRSLLLQSEAPPRTLHDGLRDLTAGLDDVRRTGIWLARFHAVPDTDLPPLPHTFEAAKIEEYVDALIVEQPTLRPRLLDIQRRLVSALDALPALPLVPTHGDFQPKNVHLDESAVVVIDFDRAALATPARDLGHFLGQSLTMAAAAGAAFDGAAASWSQALLTGYLDAGGSPAAVAATPPYVARTFLEVLFYRLVVRPVPDISFAARWLEECAAWLDGRRSAAA